MIAPAACCVELKLCVEINIYLSQSSDNRLEYNKDAPWKVHTWRKVYNIHIQSLKTLNFIMHTQDLVKMWHDLQYGHIGSLAYCKVVVTEIGTISRTSTITFSATDILILLGCMMHLIDFGLVPLWTLIRIWISSMVCAHLPHGVSLKTKPDFSSKLSAMLYLFQIQYWKRGNYIM